MKKTHKRRVMIIFFSFVLFCECDDELFKHLLIFTESWIIILHIIMRAGPVWLYDMLSWFLPLLMMGRYSALRNVSIDWKKKRLSKYVQEWGVRPLLTLHYSWCLMSYAMRNELRLRWSHIEISVYMFLLSNDGFRHLGKICSIA